MPRRAVGHVADFMEEVVLEVDIGVIEARAEIIGDGLPLLASQLPILPAEQNQRRVALRVQIDEQYALLRPERQPIGDHGGDCRFTDAALAVRDGKNGHELGAIRTFFVNEEIRARLSTCAHPIQAVYIIKSVSLSCRACGIQPDVVLKRLSQALTVFARSMANREIKEVSFGQIRRRDVDINLQKNEKRHGVFRINADW
jgi:hypothetical protein